LESSRYTEEEWNMFRNMRETYRRHRRDWHSGQRLPGGGRHGPAAGQDLLLPDLQLREFRLVLGRPGGPALDLLDPGLHQLQVLEIRTRNSIPSLAKCPVEKSKTKKVHKI
jgi:hypothetical protein